MSLPAILSAATTTAEATKMEKTVPNTKKLVFPLSIKLLLIGRAKLSNALIYNQCTYHLKNEGLFYI